MKDMGKEFTYRWCLNEDDYKIVCKLWNEWKFPSINRDLLSEHLIIASYNKVDVGVSCLYQSDSKIAWIGWTTVSKVLKCKKLRKETIKYMVDKLEYKAKDLNYKIVFHFARHNSLKEVLTNRCNFKKDLENLMLFKNIWQQEH